MILNMVESVDTKADIIRKLIIEGKLSSSEIAKISNTNRNYVNYIKKKLGIPPPPKRKYDYELLKKLASSDKTIKELSEESKYPESVTRNIVNKIMLPYKKCKKYYNEKDKIESLKLREDIRRSREIKLSIVKLINIICIDWSKEEKDKLVSEVEEKLRGVNFRGRSIEIMIATAIYLTKKCMNNIGEPLSRKEIESKIGYRIHNYYINYLMSNYDSFKDVCQINSYDIIKSRQEIIINYFRDYFTEQSCLSLWSDLLSKSSILINDKRLRFDGSSPYTKAAGVLFFVLKKHYLLTRYINGRGLQGYIYFIFNTSSPSLRTWERKLSLIDNTPPNPIQLIPKNPINNQIKNVILFNRTCKFCRTKFDSFTEDEDFCSESCRIKYAIIRENRMYKKSLALQQISLGWSNILFNNNVIIEKNDNNTLPIKNKYDDSYINKLINENIEFKKYSKLSRTRNYRKYNDTQYSKRAKEIFEHMTTENK